MNCLLDTCALIWLVQGGQELGPDALNACAEPGGGLHVSAASAWELALKQARGKLTLPRPIADWWKEVLQRHALSELPVSAQIAIASVSLPAIHSDPADRLLIATAQHYHLTLLTPDKTIARYPDVHLAW
jgi:PIN domain nuclease of toxin-antitoxin system